MNKRYKRKERYKIYRGITICINSPYSFRGHNVVALFPDVERYFKGESKVRASIDRFLNNYIPIDNGIPF